MDFKTHLKLYLNIFYFLGLSPYRADIPEAGLIKILRCCKFVQFLTCEAHSIFALILLANFQATAESTIISVYLVCDMMRAIFVLVQCICYKLHIAEIIDKIHDIDEYFLRQLEHRISYKKFKQKYNLKVFAILGIAIIYLLGYVARYFFNHRATLAVTMIKYLQLMTAFTYLHNIFYIDVLSFHLNELNSVIRKCILNNSNIVMVGPSDAANILKKLTYFKTIHFQIWELAQMINTYFGWSAITILLHAFSDLIYSAYWVFKELETDDETFTIWSKFM